MAKRIWFKAKTHGWGWTPATWQGWAVTAGYVVLAIALGLTIDENSPPNEIAFLFALPMMILTSSLVLIAYKTGEKPKWRWGEK